MSSLKRNAVACAKPSATVTSPVRPFGNRLVDLDLDFAGPQHDVVSALLQRCAARDEDVWAWLLPRRIAALAALVTATQGSRIEFMVTCPDPVCGQQMELAFDLDALPEPTATTCRCTPESDTTVVLRIPSGDDLRRWARDERPDTDEATLCRSLAADLIVAIDGATSPPNSTIPRTWLGPVAAALDDADPLSTMQIETSCPSCERSHHLEVDLEGQLLDVLRRIQARLVRDVHRLASAYHWSETEIIALPPWRRARYLTLTEASL